MADLNKFAYGALAENMRNKRVDDKYVKGSLDALADNLGFSDTAKGFIEGAYMSRQGLEMATTTYAQEHEKEMQTVTGTNLKDWYTGDVLDGLSDVDKASFNNALEKHGAETFGDISRQYRLAATKVNAPEGDYTEAEVTAARDIIEKYQTFMIANNELQDFKLEGIRANTLPFARKRHLKDLASKLI